MKSSNRKRRTAKNSQRSSLLLACIGVAVILIVLALVQNSSLSRGHNGTTTSVAPASLSLVNPLLGAVEAGTIETVEWTSSNYQSPDVSVSLIRKIGDNPARYELVRTIASSTKNDGQATWVPALSDAGSNMSIEIGCLNTTNACTAADSAPVLAVIDTGRFSNTANAYQAIENLNNK